MECLVGALYSLPAVASRFAAWTGVLALVVAMGLWIRERCRLARLSRQFGTLSEMEKVRLIREEMRVDIPVDLAADRWLALRRSNYRPLQLLAMGAVFLAVVFEEIIEPLSRPDAPSSAHAKRMGALLNQGGSPSRLPERVLP